MQTATEEPLVVEPVDPPRREKKPRKRPHAGEGREAPPARACCGKRVRANSRPKTPVRELRPDERFVVGMLFLLGVLGLMGLAWLGGTHSLRVAVTLLAVAAGFTVGISVSRRRDWYTRLGWMAAGLALAGLSAWFVPTLHGVNLWSAYRQVQALRTLPAGEIAEYQHGEAARRLLVQEFPSFAPDVSGAEQAWLRRTVDEAIESTDRRLESDPHAALADLLRLNAELTPLEHYTLVKNELESARLRAVQACAKATRREVEDLRAKK